MSFGREAIDANGTRDFPDASMLTGLIANALGWRREEAARQQRLQDRLAFGVLVERRGHDLRDFQTAKLEKSDQGWTTRGESEGRAGGSASYDSSHIRFRHYRADAAILVAMTLADADEGPLPMTSRRRSPNPRGRCSSAASRVFPPRRSRA